MRGSKSSGQRADPPGPVAHRWRALRVLALVGLLVAVASGGSLGSAVDDDGDQSSDPLIQRYDPFETPLIQDDMAYGEDANEAIDDQITRLYLAYFERQPADDGLGFWREKRKTGTTVVDVAATFAESEEFTNRYGQADNRQFVTLVFDNVLGRQPKDDGLDYWAESLDAGASRGAIMVGFSDSQEFINATGTLPPPPPPPPPPEPVQVVSEPEPSTVTPVATATPVAVQLPRAYTPTPVTWEQVRGVRILDQLPYQWEDKLRGWSIHFKPAKFGYLGLAWPAERRIEVYVRSDLSDAFLAHVVAHELGHAVDVSLNSGSDRAAWQAARGISWAPWWPSAYTSDYSTGAGDFAEAFAFTQVSSYTYFRSNLSGTPTWSQRNLMATLANG